MKYAKCILALALAAALAIQPAAAWGAEELAVELDTQVPVSSAGGQSTTSAEAEPERDADPTGTLRFENVEPRVRGGSLAVRALQNNIARLEAMDYKKLQRELTSDLDDLENLLTQLEGMSLGITPGASSASNGAKIGTIAATAQVLDSIGAGGAGGTGGGTGTDGTDPETPVSTPEPQPDPVAPALSAAAGVLGDHERRLVATEVGLNVLNEMVVSNTESNLEAARDALSDRVQDLKNGKTQRDGETAIRQLQDLQDQAILGTQALYIALVSMESQEASLNRQLAALDRQLTEMTLRYELGQISALTLEQLQNGREQMISGMQTLHANIVSRKMQLENMIGESNGGTLMLMPLPEVSAGNLSSMSVERDLYNAKKESYTLLAAQQELETAKREYDSAVREYGRSETNYKYVMARRALDAAQEQYDSTVANYELSFRQLFLTVSDAAQVLEASRQALGVKQSEYAAQELRYSQGNISRNTLLSSRDELSAAEESVQTALENLFAAYNNYCWARERGIVN